MVHAMTPRAIWIAVSAGVLCACGARTGLRVDDTAMVEDASIDGGASDAPFACVPGTFVLTRTRAELVLLVDRSGSMMQNINGGEAPPRKWDDLREALARTLPEFESQVELGAMAYPRRFDGSMARSCDIERALDVEPGPLNATAVLHLLESTDPWGATPTNDAVEFLGSRLLTRVSRATTAAIVLATDGGPNCNPRLDAATCACTATPTVPPCDDRPSNCIDDARTVEAIARFANVGVPTFVIGLDNTTVPAERDALVAMAHAGGRPNPLPGMPPYYSVRDPAAVVEAFRVVQKSVVECRRSMASRPDDPDSVQVKIAGADIPRDRSHLNGWDWASADFGQIDFFGAACATLGDSRATATATVLSCGSL
jgi:hypothetical protein